MLKYKIGMNFKCLRAIYERISSYPMKLRIVSLEPFIESLLDMIWGRLDEAMSSRLNVVES